MELMWTYLAADGSIFVEKEVGICERGKFLRQKLHDPSGLFKSFFSSWFSRQLTSNVIQV